MIFPCVCKACYVSNSLIICCCLHILGKTGIPFSQVKCISRKHIATRHYNIQDITRKKAKIQKLKKQPQKMSESKKYDETLKSQNKTVI